MKHHPIILTAYFWSLVLFPWLAVVKRFLFIMEMILRSSTTAVFRGRLGLFALLSTPVLACFLRMYKTVDFASPNIVAVSQIGFFLFLFFCPLAASEKLL